MSGRRKEFVYSVGEMVGGFEVKECIYGDPFNNRRNEHRYRVVCVKCFEETLKTQYNLKRYVEGKMKCRCHLKGQKSDFKYEVGEEIGSMIIVKRYWQECKMYELECTICKKINVAQEVNMSKKRKCTFCQHTTSKVAENVNSIVASEDTLWMAEYFLGGYDEAKCYRPNSNKLIELKCPSCQTIVPTKIIQLKNRGGISCPCSKSCSIPERVVGSLLKMNNIEYIPQFSSKDQSWCGSYKYDFYLPKYNTIIETHGSQHYEGHRHPKWKSYEEEQKNDKQKEALAKSKGIEQYIVLDCRKSHIDTLIKNVIKEEFLKTIILNTNKGEMMHYFKNTLMGEVCSYYETNKPILLKEVAEKFNIYSSTVRHYLRMGDEIGLCSYNKEEIIKYGKTKSGQRPKQIRVYTNEEEIGIFPSAKETVALMEDLYGVKLQRSKISNCCNGKRKSHQGYFFEFC